MICVSGALRLVLVAFLFTACFKIEAYNAPPTATPAPIAKAEPQAEAQESQQPAAQRNAPPAARAAAPPVAPKPPPPLPPLLPPVVVQDLAGVQREAQAEIEKTEAAFVVTQEAYDKALKDKAITQAQYAPWRVFFERTYVPAMTAVKTSLPAATTPSEVADITTRIKLLRVRLEELKAALDTRPPKKSALPILLALAEIGSEPLDYKPAPDPRWTAEDWVKIITSVGVLLTAILGAMASLLVVINKRTVEARAAATEAKTLAATAVTAATGAETAAVRTAEQAAHALSTVSDKADALGVATDAKLGVIHELVNSRLTLALEENIALRKLLARLYPDDPDVHNAVTKKPAI